MSRRVFDIHGEAVPASKLEASIETESSRYTEIHDNELERHNQGSKYANQHDAHNSSDSRDMLFANSPWVTSHVCSSRAVTIDKGKNKK